MQNEDELSIDDGQHHSHWNEEHVDTDIPPPSPADDRWEPCVNGAKSSQAKSQHGRDHKEQDPDEDRRNVKKFLSLFFILQLLEVQWSTDGKKSVANLDGDPNGQRVDNKTRYNTWELQQNKQGPAVIGYVDSRYQSLEICNSAHGFVAM